LCFRQHIENFEEKKVCNFADSEVHKARVAPSGEQLNLDLVMYIFAVIQLATLAIVGVKINGSAVCFYEGA